MELKTYKRPAEKKSQAKKERLEGRIPAVIYSQGKEAEAISVDRPNFEQAIAQTKLGHLSTVQFTLKGEDGKTRKAVVKDIQYHVTTYDVLHVDLQEVQEDVEINVNVPVECRGVADCVGIKHGGVLRQVIRKVRVRCLPKNIPEQFVLNVADLEMKQTRRLRDIEIPEGVRPLVNLNEVAVVIAKR